MRIPVSFLTEFKDKSSFRLAVTFYSLINSATSVSNDGKSYILMVKQDTLSRCSGMSISTVKRTLIKLSDNGFITFRIRTHKENGELGTYIYYIKKAALNSRYFYVQRKALQQISSTKDFYVYCYLCQLANTKEKSLIGCCFHSYNDLQKMLNISRSDAIEIINRLCIELKLVRKQRVVCSAGDFTENKYIIVAFVTGRIKRRGIKKGMRDANTHTLKVILNIQYSESHNNLIKILHHCKAFVKPFCKKSCNFFFNRGSPLNELSIFNPLKYIYLSEYKLSMLLLKKTAYLDNNIILFLRI